MRDLTQRLLPMVLVFLLPTALPAFPQEAPESPETMVRYDGAAKIFNVDRLAVIYPVAQDRETAGWVGRRIADYIAASFGVQTEAFPDDDVPQAALEGHLVVLGWDNALLDGSPYGHPFPQREDGFRVGEFQSGPDDDLIYVHVSPYNPQKYLVFWSRVNVEAARFSVFPFIPTEWAAVREYHPYARGLLVDSTEWPPAPQPFGYLEDSPTLSPPRVRSKHFTLHDKMTTLTDEERHEILEIRERAYAQAIEGVGDPGKDFRIDLFLYPDLESKTKQNGVPDAVHEIPWKYQLHMVLANARNPSPHDEIQLIARARYGACLHTAFCEGLPLALGMGTRKDSDELGVYAALMLRGDRLPALDDLFHEEILRKSTRQGSGYPSIALMNLWLLDRVDTKQFGELFSGRLWTTKKLAATLGVEPAALEQEFSAFVRARAKGAEKELDLRTALAEAHREIRDGAPDRAIPHLAQAVELAPEDLELRYRWGLALLESGKRPEAELRFAEVIEKSDPAKPTYFLAHGHLQLGDLRLAAGDSAGAEQHYRAALDLPDIQGSHEIAEEALGELP